MPFQVLSGQTAHVPGLGDGGASVASHRALRLDRILLAEIPQKV